MAGYDKTSTKITDSLQALGIDIHFEDSVDLIDETFKNIDDVLPFTVDEAITFFGAAEGGPSKRICERLGSLQEVGLGYIHLGQASSTLSGGEAQRVKLASFLVKKESSSKLLFIFDEPTTGLHFHDIKKLLKAFDALSTQGHSV